MSLLRVININAGSAKRAPKVANCGKDAGTLMSLVPLPQTLIPFLEPYLPAKRQGRPFVTLTWAQSLDLRIAGRPGVQTHISHVETKTMTHYLRAYHDAILVGVGTVLADDPKLNCRYGNFSKIRPVVVDPQGKWVYSTSTLCRIHEDHQGLAPFIIIDSDVEPTSEEIKLLATHDGAFLKMKFGDDRVLNWPGMLDLLAQFNISSVMVEGGSVVINDLLQSSLVDSVIVTVGPLFLGRDGVQISPAMEMLLADTTWWKGQKDTVLAGRLKPKEDEEV